MTMGVLGIGISYGVATLFAMFSGMPIAFALGAVAVVFMAIYMPTASLDTVTQNVYEEMASITLLSIPLFILKGAAIGRTRAGQDLYAAMHVWMSRIPGGLGIANSIDQDDVGGCACEDFRIAADDRDAGRAPLVEFGDPPAVAADDHEIGPFHRAPPIVLALDKALADRAFHGVVAAEVVAGGVA